ncbi:unnamed protein product [Symbiodinium sp. CCMP2592]|nr:unnamed protein product [Symbiodinium sp. CCMP2592]
MRQELNGLRATIIDWSEAEERWRVLLEDSTGKMLRTEHLVLVRRAREPSPPPPAGIWTPQWKAPGGYAISLAPGDRVRVKLQEAPLLEDREGVIVRWEPDLNKWKVRFSNGSCELLAQTSLEPMEDWNVPGPTQGSTVRRQPPAEEEAPCFGADARVVVQGLQVRPDLNGKLGSVVTWDTAEHRYKVQLDDGTGKMLRPANLRLATVQDDPRLGAPEVSGRGHGGPHRWKDGAPSGDVRGSGDGLVIGQRVRVRGLIERSELNGRLGEVAGWDDVEERWKAPL